MGCGGAQAGEDEGSEAAVRAAKVKLDELTKLFTSAEAVLKTGDLTEEERMEHPTVGPLLEAQKNAAEELVRCLDARRNALPYSVQLERKQRKVREKQAHSDRGPHQGQGRRDRRGHRGP